MPPRRRARQQLLRQEAPPPVYRPPTVEEIAQVFAQKEALRRQQKQFLFRGIVWIFVFGGLLTAAVHYHKQRVLRQEREQYRVVISIAPTSSELLSLQPLLESLVEQQDFPPRMVYLVTSTNDDAPLPRFVQQYVNNKVVYIISPSSDFGPINNYYYGVEMESFDTRIIAIDSSSVKPVETSFISNMVKQSLQYPDAVIGFEGTKLKGKNKLVFEPFNTSETAVVDILKGPTMVQRRFFNVDGFKEMVQSLGDQHYANSIVVAAHLEQQGIERRVVKRFIRLASLSTMTGDIVEAIKYFQEHLGVWRNVKFPS